MAEVTVILQGICTSTRRPRPRRVEEDARKRLHGGATRGVVPVEFLWPDDVGSSAETGVWGSGHPGDRCAADTLTLAGKTAGGAPPAGCPVPRLRAFGRSAEPTRMETLSGWREDLPARSAESHTRAPGATTGRSSGSDAFTAVPGMSVVRCRVLLLAEFVSKASVRVAQVHHQARVGV